MQKYAEKVIFILFTRYPEPGSTKTRLIPGIGAQAAAQLQQKMTEFTLGQIQEAMAFTPHEVHVHYTGACLQAMQEWLGEGLVYEEQGQGDLGQRLQYAFELAFAKGAQKVIVIGADCPDNRKANIHKAVQALDDAPCVFGPASDGGYYLVGLTQPHPQLFTHISWGSSSVLAESLHKVPHYALLPVLGDVDYACDIPPTISVIIPAYNEEKHIARAIHSAQQAFGVEVLVADGGSFDATASLAQNLGATVYLCPPEQRGRARQMNFVAAKAQGDIVLFLHADSLLPPEWDRAVRQALHPSQGATEEPSLGYFQFAVSGDFFGKSLLTWGTNMRAQYLHKPYGDQGFFMRKQDFFKVQGYADVPILEDVLLAKAVRKQGKLIPLPLPLVTSGRRWQEHGSLKVTFFNQCILLAASFGMDLQRLHHAYKKGSFFS